MEPQDSNHNIDELFKQIVRNFKAYFTQYDPENNEIIDPSDSMHPDKPQSKNFHISYRFDSSMDKPEIKYSEKPSNSVNPSLNGPGTHGRLPKQKKEKELFTDVFDNGSELMIIVEIPGVPKDDIHLSINGLELEITTPRQHKIVQLPSAVNENEIKARYHNGILELRLPKLSQSDPIKQNIPID